MLASHNNRNVINTAIIGMAVLVFLLSDVLAWSSYQGYETARRIVRINRLADSAMAMSSLQGEERGMVAGMIGHATWPSNQIPMLTNEIDGRWKAFVASARKLATELPPGSGFDVALAQAEERYQRIIKLRGRFERPESAAVGGGPAVWIAAVTDWITGTVQLSEVAYDAIRERGDEDPTLQTLRRQVWLISEHAGLERGTVEFYISARKPIPDPVLDRLKGYRGVANYNLNTVVSTSRYEVGDVRITHAVERMRRSFIQNFAPLRQQVYADAKTAEYSVNGKEWWTRASRAVDSAQALNAVISDISNQRANHEADVRKWQMTGYFLIVLTTLFMAFVSVLRVRRTADALFHEKERAEVTLHSIGDAVITTDAEARVESLNPQAEELTGWLSEEAVGRPLHKVFTIVNGLTREKEASPVEVCLQERRIVGLGTNTLLISRDGTEYLIEDSAAPILDRQGNILGVVMVFYDVTSMRQAPHLLSYHATHDALTGLVNRREFERQLVELLSDAKTSGKQHALCYMDLDQFKLVNDTCGHSAGDALLRQLTYLLQQHIREADCLARLGGDEFGVLLVSCPLSRAQRIAGELCRVVKDFRFKWENQTFDLGASIGLVAITADSTNPQELLSRADTACFAAKEKGRNCVEVYRPDNTELVRRHGEMHWVSRIRSALEEDRFILYCQPVHTLCGDDQKRCEILLRLFDEHGEVVPPGAFLPAAERYGLMPDIDRWVVSSTLSIMKQHNCDGEYAINISGTSLGDHDFLDFIREQLVEHGVSGSLICFEITETAAVANLQEAAKFIETLKADGCHFALDDFGSGLSSFTYLKNLPVDYLKIDGAFVRDIVDDPLDEAMVRSINEIGHLMGMKTVAEFVENEKILAKLKEIGVDYAQGFFFTRPGPLESCLSECNSPTWGQVLQCHITNHPPSESHD